jgi:NAD(P)-dependent dehydrogenase (short-subunit alcohol dehydrogenase family)
MKYQDQISKKMSKTIAIIGAGPGVGLAIAEQFGREGFRVALLGRNPENLSKLSEALSSKGIESKYFTADVMDRPGLETALKEVLAVFGRIDVLEYGPSPAPDSIRPFSNLDIDSVVYQFEFNVLGAMAAVQTVLPQMRERGGGAILFTSAVSAQNPVAVTANFGIAAGGLLNYTRLLHNNLKAESIYAGIVSIAAFVSRDGQEMPAGFPPGLPVVSAQEVAAQHWQLYTERKGYEAIVGDEEGILAILGS